MSQQVIPHWIDVNDKIFYRQKDGKSRPKYKVVCSSCGKDRGYQLLQNCKTHPNCIPCSRKLDEQRTIAFWQAYHQANTPWNKGKTGVFSSEVKAKISQASSNRNYSEEQKESIKLKKQLTFAAKLGFSSVEEFELAKKLKRNLRSRLNKAISGKYKTGSAVDDLGCSIEELKKHLELQFKPGMSWDNYGEWEIDHIKPLNKFNLLDTVQLQAACYYKNLQPLWHEDNLSKRMTDGTF
jgi:hypothetical protein